MAEKVKRLFLTADSLWEFLKHAVTSNNQWQAFQRLNSGLTDSAPYRIWKRFQNAESAIRTALAPLTKPPTVSSQQPAEQTLTHLEQAFEQHPLSPVAAFQATLQVFFM